jgi:hypothetical protein
MAGLVRWHLPGNVSSRAANDPSRPSMHIAFSAVNCGCKRYLISGSVHLARAVRGIGDGPLAVPHHTAPAVVVVVVVRVEFAAAVGLWRTEKVGSPGVLALAVTERRI